MIWIGRGIRWYNDYQSEVDFCKKHGFGFMDVKHEHLSLTQGDIDYNFVFSNFLHGFKGRVILEIDGTDEEIIKSKEIIDQAITFAE